jgi:hypothetical protein
MPIAGFYFDGFSSSDGFDEPNVFTRWRDKLIAEPGFSSLVLNRKRETELLTDRWKRLEKLSPWLSDDDADIHVLAYSLGCHLAVRFATELIRDIQRIRSFWLIAPDPKFQDNEYDRSDPPSAYGEAHTFWGGADSPGHYFCERLARISKAKQEQEIQVIYSKADAVARWIDDNEKGNVQKMQENCPDCDWIEVRAPLAIDLIQNNLQPAQEPGDVSVHQQLFTKWLMNDFERRFPQSLNR